MLWGEDSHLLEDSSVKHEAARGPGASSVLTKAGVSATAATVSANTPTTTSDTHTHTHTLHSPADARTIFTTVWILVLTLNASVGVITPKWLLLTVFSDSNKHAWYSRVDYGESITNGNGWSNRGNCFQEKWFIFLQRHYLILCTKQNKRSANGSTGSKYVQRSWDFPLAVSVWSVDPTRHFTSTGSQCLVDSISLNKRSAGRMY